MIEVRGEMYRDNKAILIELEGNAFERGLMHGETLNSLIQETIKRWKYHLKLNYQISPNKLIKKFMQNTYFVKSVKKNTPDLFEEVKGISEGSGINFNTIFAFQCLDERWWFSKYSNNSNCFDHCSSIGCYKSESHPTLLAQNMDLFSFLQGLQLVLKIKDSISSLQTYILTIPGLIGLCGLNNAPLGICCNSLKTLNHSELGLPVAFILRNVLQKKTLEDARNFIHEVVHASGQNYIIGGIEKVICLECSANKVVEFMPTNYATRVYHTNHPLVNDDIITPLESIEFYSSSWDRLNYLKFRLQDESEIINLDGIKHILRSHFGPICVHQNFKPNDGFTFGSVVYSMSEGPAFYLAIGPPCLNNYQEYKFDIS